MAAPSTTTQPLPAHSPYPSPTPAVCLATLLCTIFAILLPSQLPPPPRRPQAPLTGPLAYRSSFIDMANTSVAPVNTSSWAARGGRTCPPAMGMSFAAGTTDGGFGCGCVGGWVGGWGL